MLTTREFLRLGALVTAGTLLACANDSTGPVAPAPVSSGRVFTSVEIRGAYPMARITGLNNRRLEVRARDQNGVLMMVESGSFSISSENPGVATVSVAEFWTESFNGVPYGSWLETYVTALAPGEAVISVSWTVGGVTRTAKSTIRVESTEGWSLMLDPAALTMKLGSSKPIGATLVDAAGNPRLRAPGEFTSDRDDVVNLRYDEYCFILQPCPDIVVHGVTVGEATITAKFEGFSAKGRVTVVP